MLIVDADESIRGAHPDYWDAIVKGLMKRGIMLAIEVKYANMNYDSDFRKLAKLQKMTPYDIVPVFAYIGYSTSNEDVSGQYQALLRKSKQNGVVLLFGDPHHANKWTVDNLPSC